MDVFRTRYFKYCRLQLLFVGMWPYQNKIAAISIKTCLSVLAAVFITGEIQHIIKSRNQLQLFLEPIPYLLAVCAVGIKYLTIWIRSGTMRKTMNRIQYDWHNAALNNEDHILKANAEKAWRFSRFYILTIYVYVFGLLSVQIIPDVLNLSISNNSFLKRYEQHVRGEFFLAQDKYYALIATYLIVAFILTIVAAASMTLQWIMIINHACGLYAIVGYRLEHAFDVSWRKRGRKGSVKKILHHTVEYHKEIIKYIATVNSNYSVYYVPLLIIGIIVLSTLLIQVSTAMNCSSCFEEVLLLATFVVVGLWYIFVDAISAQKLIDASSKVFRQIYDGEWYNASISDQKTLLFIMQNCMQPLTISTAKIITISVKKFGMIVRVSMSCFTMLYSLS